MAIKDEIIQLKACQEIDAVVFELSEKINEIPIAIQALNDRFEGEKSALNKLEEHLKQTRLDLKNKEGDLKSKEELIQKHESQLAQVKTNKEYSALQGEISMEKQSMGSLEEEIIILLDEIGQIEGEYSKEKERLDKEKALIDQEINKFEEERKDCAAKIENLRQEKDELIKPVDAVVARLYSQIVSKKSGIALAQLKGEMCGACGTQLRPQVINDVMTGDEVVQCDACQRILYPEKFVVGS